MTHIKSLIAACLLAAATACTANGGNALVPPVAAPPAASPASAIAPTAADSSAAGAPIAPSASAQTARADVIPHVITADYLGGLYGTHKIAWSAAAPYLTWAETDTTNANAIHAAGMKTMDYVDPNRTQLTAPMFTHEEATYAHDCSGRKVTDVYAGDVTQYVMNPASPAMQRLFAQYVRGIQQRAHFDALFEDDAGALSAFAPYDPFSAMPCKYDDATWIAQENQLNAVSPVPILFNGLSGLHGKAPSLAIGLLAAPTTIGGTFEQCFSSNDQAKMDGWFWSAIENTALAVGAKDKQFECMASRSASASGQTDARIYAYASFLLTYDPSTSIYRDSFATPSGLHVEPETELVALDAAAPLPRTVSGLRQNGGTYARRYGACYLKRVPVGPCAVVVNPDQDFAYPFPFSGFHHTLVLHGGGVLDGGTASTQGPPPPAKLAVDTAVIAFQ